MTDFSEAYTGLLIQQYHGQPNARAEISLHAARAEKIRDLLQSFPVQFDLDLATGDRLDKIGKLVGLRRTSRPEFSDDDEYRFFIGVKIAVNNGSAYMVSDTLISIQAVIQQAFAGQAFVIDNQDMTLLLTVDSTFDPVRLQLVIDLGLLPKPQGVRYLVTSINTGALNFGFSELGLPDPTDAGTYSELGFPAATDGEFAESTGT